MKTLLLALGLLAVAQPVLADRQDPFVTKFNHLLCNPKVVYRDARLDILYQMSWAEMISLGLIGGFSTLGAAVVRETGGKVVFGLLGASMFGVMAYKAWKVHARVPALSFTEQGLQTDSTFQFNWGQIEEVKIEEVFDSIYTGHGFQPVDGYQFQTGSAEQQYAGRRLVVYGKHKSRLWVVEERANSLAIGLNDLIDVVEYYRGRYSRK